MAVMTDHGPKGRVRRRCKLPSGPALVLREVGAVDDKPVFCVTQDTGSKDHVVGCATGTGPALRAFNRWCEKAGGQVPSSSDGTQAARRKKR